MRRRHSRPEGSGVSYYCVPSSSQNFLCWEVDAQKLEDKELNLWRAFTEHGMRPQMFEQLSKEYEDERQRNTTAINLMKKENGEVVDNLDAALAVISEIANRYSEHTAQRQRDIVKRMIINPEGRIIRIELKPPFNYLDLLAKGETNGTRGKGSSVGTKKTSTMAGSFQITGSSPYGVSTHIITLSQS